MPVPFTLLVNKNTRDVLSSLGHDYSEYRTVYRLLGEWQKVHRTLRLQKMVFPIKLTWAIFVQYRVNVDVSFLILKQSWNLELESRRNLRDCSVNPTFDGVQL